jgi:hypothetical protein
MMVSPVGSDRPSTTFSVPQIHDSAHIGIAQSAEGATEPSPDREVGVGEQYDGEPRRVRHKVKGTIGQSPEAGVPGARFVRWGGEPGSPARASCAWGGKGRVKIARHVSAGT